MHTMHQCRQRRLNWYLIAFTRCKIANCIKRVGGLVVSELSFRSVCHLEIVFKSIKKESSVKVDPNRRRENMCVIIGIVSGRKK